MAAAGKPAARVIAVRRSDVARNGKAGDVQPGTQPPGTSHNDQGNGSPVRVLRVVRGAATASVEVGARAANGTAGGKQRASQRSGSQPASPDRSAAVASLAHRAGVHSVEALLRLLSPRGLAEVETSLAAMQQVQQQKQPIKQQRGRAAAGQQHARLGAGAAVAGAPEALLLPLPASLL